MQNPLAVEHHEPGLWTNSTPGSRRHRSDRHAAPGDRRHFRLAGDSVGLGDARSGSTAPPPNNTRWFFPASALGRKGIHELAAALRESGGELLILGRAREGRAADPLANTSHRQATVADLTGCTALVIPAWVEHEPRLALRALAMGIPVIASHACGLPAHPLLTEIEAGNVADLTSAMMGSSLRSGQPSS